MQEHEFLEQSHRMTHEVVESGWMMLEVCLVVFEWQRTKTHELVESGASNKKYSSYH